MLKFSSAGRFVQIHCLRSARFSSTSTTLTRTSPAREFKVVLDGQTLYIGKPLAEALGWTPQSGINGVKLSLHGWDPKFFVITPSDTDSGWLARRTVESGQNPNVQAVLNLLKEYDASAD